MKYIIMADGKGLRWNNNMGIPKHLVEIEGETLLHRTVRQIQDCDKEAEIVITSHDRRYEVSGAVRYEPQNNVLEIDRFTYELIEDNICFLYGDTYYTDKSIAEIVSCDVEDILFFGNESSIVAIKIKNGDIFRNCVDTVKQLFIDGKIKNCIGWQVYQCFNHYEYDVKRIGEKYVLLKDETMNINRLEEFQLVKNRIMEKKK